MRQNEYSSSIFSGQNQSNGNNYSGSQAKPYKNASSIVISDDTYCNRPAVRAQVPPINTSNNNSLTPLLMEPPRDTHFDRQQKFTSSGQNKIPIGMRGDG